MSQSIRRLLMLLGAVLLALLTSCGAVRSPQEQAAQASIDAQMAVERAARATIEAQRSLEQTAQATIKAQQFEAQVAEAVRATQVTERLRSARDEIFNNPNATSQDLQTAAPILMAGKWERSGWERTGQILEFQITPEQDKQGGKALLQSRDGTASGNYDFDESRTLLTIENIGTELDGEYMFILSKSFLILLDHPAYKEQVLFRRVDSEDNRQGIEALKEGIVGTWQGSIDTSLGNEPRPMTWEFKPIEDHMLSGEVKFSYLLQKEETGSYTIVDERTIYINIKPYYLGPSAYDIEISGNILTMRLYGGDRVTLPPSSDKGDKLAWQFQKVN